MGVFNKSRFKDCLSDEDNSNVFYHATPSRNVSNIMRDGLKPGKGETFDTQDWSTDKLFLAYGFDEAMQWQGMIEEQLGEPVSVLQVTLTPKERRAVMVDTAARDDDNQCSFYVTFAIAPERITIAHDGGGQGPSPVVESTTQLSSILYSSPF